MQRSMKKIMINSTKFNKKSKSTWSGWFGPKVLSWLSPPLLSKLLFESGLRFCVRAGPKLAPWGRPRDWDEAGPSFSCRGDRRAAGECQRPATGGSSAGSAVKESTQARSAGSVETVLCSQSCLVMKPQKRSQS